MLTVLPAPDAAADWEPIEVALARMEALAQRREQFSQHLQLCPECDADLCPAGAELMRTALAG